MSVQVLYYLSAFSESQVLLLLHIDQNKTQRSMCVMKCTHASFAHVDSIAHRSIQKKHHFAKLQCFKQCDKIEVLVLLHVAQKHRTQVLN